MRQGPWGEGQLRCRACWAHQPGSQDWDGRLCQAQGSGLRGESPGLFTPSAPCQPQTHHLRVLDAPRIGPGGSGRGPRIPLLVSAVHVLRASSSCLGLTLLRILPYRHKRNGGRRARKSTRCQSQVETSGTFRAVMGFRVWLHCYFLSASVSFSEKW